MGDAANEHCLEVGGELADLARIIETADALWEQYRVDAETQAGLNIAIEEILSNILRHGGPGVQPIYVRISVDPANVQIEIQDHGVPFNPLTHPLPDTHLPLEQRRRGGLGILMVLKLMDRTGYERRDGANCFTMTKQRAPQTS